ncbi:50S ribosomal protein L28 [Candidatus Kuenenbacteria bacterium CG_4_9_14_3_um_filter_39_14]|uniref:50S ribosomal protein L28 n=5 Tax=Candidatus Kueneniibacteriota TaxID=1752740 RepID=A0A2M7IM99_9BACT|nr:50S ribosomal protein L28 [Candidatus Kuenenbacteria bacterium]PIP75650.1 MAG: 50S ribosomal protein L28 [Candidatus Kuenenbacteria bacterium CG22_combo_CG10-13_8_21_14_all_39_9]PIR80955.1 MAG: 50S ribosomal protein L28 [Candidatus Kuenenbacteria bacterium CG10_big_fil_rev_8_21_14_0_10_39_14]PIW95933.1 MAG: 50S ribosomal protein L28 [Candidatus Kuenenbacteria bacterium CG_4_8_14_3_um_filter_39_15]PIX92630.1 MAG: 50S ribosomal protein L28 [Candidatus Kuenenbacteria bacterium CG_4_10_14_3_um_f
MSRICDMCGRGPQKSIQRSHANNKMIIRKFINLQARTINGKKKKVCTRCLRTIKKKMA